MENLKRYIYNIDLPEKQSPGTSKQFATNKKIKLIEEASDELLAHLVSSNRVNVTDLNLGLVVDGLSLNFILNDDLCRNYFAMITCLTSAVICCRVSPLQKA